MWQKLVNLYHKMGSPKWFYEISGRWIPWFAAASLLFLGAGLIWGLAFSPADYQQGNSFRIMFIHVPAALLSQSCYVLMAITGAISLIWKMKLSGLVARACAPIGASMAIIALLTGAIWGKPTWGAWWVWDARLTSMLVLLFLYFGVIALYSAIEDDEMATKACAVLSLVGLVNIPIIKYSVEWWNTLHQPASITFTEKPSMHWTMFTPLVLMILGFYCLFSVLLMMRTRNEVLHRERKTKWVKKLVRA